MIQELPTLSQASKLKMESFLAGFGKFGTFRGASKATGVSRQTVSRWYELDCDGFQSRMDGARADFVERLEDKLFNQVLDKDSPNPLLLMFTLKAHNRAKYGDALTVTNDKAAELLSAVRALPSAGPVVEGGEVVEVGESVRRALAR